MKRLQPWLLIALVFIAGFASGLVATRVGVRRFVRAAIQDPNFVRDRVERRTVARLDLDPQQRAQLHTILVHTQTDIKALRAEFQPRFLVIMNRAESEISAILNPDQLQRFKRFQEENRHWWQPR